MSTRFMTFDLFVLYIINTYYKILHFFITHDKSLCIRHNQKKIEDAERLLNTYETGIVMAKHNERQKGKQVIKELHRKKTPSNTYSSKRMGYLELSLSHLYKSFIVLYQHGSRDTSIVIGILSSQLEVRISEVVYSKS